MRSISALITMFILVLLSSGAGADTVYLKNGDKITGKILSEQEGRITMETKAMGTIDIAGDSVKKTVLEYTGGEGEKDTNPKIIWKREVSLGYNTSRGNTETGEISGDFLINRDHKHVNETTLKGNLYYSEANKKMDAQKWYGLGRYAFSFGEKKMWYNFYRIEADHDKFADINYRLLPAVGVGYWIFDLEDTKLLTELGAGWEHTDYRDQAKSSDEAVLIPRIYCEKRVLEHILLSEDFYFYLSLSDFDGYRLRSETAVTGELTDKLAIRLSLIDEYNSRPKGEGTKKNDLRLMSSLVCSF